MAADDDGPARTLAFVFGPVGWQRENMGRALYDQGGVFRDVFDEVARECWPTLPVALGDVVYVDLPSVGDALEKGESFGAVESVKAASDVYMPAGGEVLEANEALESEPSLVNEGAMTDGWFIKIKVADEAELGELMDEAAYEAHCEAEDH